MLQLYCHQIRSGISKGMCNLGVSVVMTDIYPHFYYSFTVKKVKFSRYRPGVAQRVGRSIALLFHDRGTRRG